ncbi:MAG: hypothetical protein A2705_02255 [Omnitrophica WOR_2 bacterium RIFCSPHIGHO2_01_FULL_52_10]|nr:MAG: hypothetical protein A2705_02255 [Omnitrophica WOR_2 bacterium RIFCSPHIGHO2_01_FULL_52_10]
MNVLVTTSTFPRWPNDAGSPFVYELCQRLREQGLNVVVLAPHARGARKFEVVDGLKIFRYQYLPEMLEGLTYDGGILSKLRANKFNYLGIPFFLFFQLWAIRRIVKAEQIKTLHAHWVLPQGLVAAFYKKMFNPRMKIVCTAHGSDLLALKSPFLRWLKRLALREIDRLTVVSHALEDEIRRLAVDNIPVEVLPMGVDLAHFTPDHYSDAIKEKHGVRGELLLFVGRLSEEKGIEYLIKAMPEILGRFPAAKLLIVGSGPLENQLRVLVENTGIAANVVFVGPVAHLSLADYYATADVLIGPSVREGFGLVFVEAMACGCPVIASDLPGIADIIVEGKTGFCVRSLDSQAIAGKTIEVLQDQSLREQVKSQARAYVAARFSAQRAAARYKEILA